MAEATEVSLYIRRLQVISQDGLTIYHYPDTFQKNPQLISGMLSAVFLFIQEEYGGSVKSIRLSDRKINFMRYGNYLIILELETYVDEGCTQIFFDYLLDLLKPVFDKAGMDYNLAITLLESIDMGQIFSYQRQLEILMRHEVPRALQEAFVLMKRNDEEVQYLGYWPEEAVNHFCRLFKSKKHFEEMNIGKSDDGSFQTLISDQFTRSGVLYLFLPTYSFELLIALPEKQDDVLLHIGTGLKNMFSNLFDLYPLMDLEKIRDYLLSLRFPTEITHQHEKRQGIGKAQLPDLNPVKLGVLAFELMGSDMAVVVENILTGEQTALLCGEVAAFAVKTFFEHFLPSLIKGIHYITDEFQPKDGEPLILAQPILGDKIRQHGYMTIELGNRRQKPRASSLIYRIYREASQFTLENRVIYFAKRINEIIEIYGDMLFSIVADFDRAHAREHLKKIKDNHKEIYALGKKKLEKEHPKLIPHLIQLERGTIS